MKKTLLFILLGLGWVSQVNAQPAAFTYLNLSKVANRSVTESFDDASMKVKDLQEKNGFKYVPVGVQVFRGIPFQIIDPVQNNGLSYVALKGHHQSEFPLAVSIPANHLKTAELFFLQTCRWGGTAPNIKIGEYDILYADGQVAVVPLHVGVEITNFWYSDDTSKSFVAWWYKYKNAGMGLNLFPWENPRPNVPIESILFKSLGKMPIPILFAVTASNQLVPVSNVSPKPEKPVRNDTSLWEPFSAQTSSTQGTVLDMSSLLDTPAGKHGMLEANYEKLVFADGTAIRFWGTLLDESWVDFTPDQQAQMANKLAQLGCNLVAVDLSNEVAVPAGLVGMVSALKAVGVYTRILNPHSLVLPVTLTQDPAVVPEGLLNEGQAVWNKPVAEAMPPLVFNDAPMVLNPDQSLPAQLSFSRILGKPYGVFWQDGRPNEFLAEAPFLMAAYGLFENWDEVLGMKISNVDWNGELTLDGHLSNNPSLWLQWPIAALAYIRGDLREGKLFVLKTQDFSDLSPVNQLKLVAHRSGFNPGARRLTTDPTGEVHLSVDVADKTLITDDGQIDWKGNVGIIQIRSPRFQALIGFLGNRSFNNSTWSLETPNLFASVCAISLTDSPLSTSTHLLLSGVARMENTGMIYNQAKTKLLDTGEPPVLREPFTAKVTLKRYRKDLRLRVRGLDANGKAIAEKIHWKWSEKNLVIAWESPAVYIEVYR